MTTEEEIEQIDLKIEELEQKLEEKEKTIDFSNAPPYPEYVEIMKPIENKIRNLSRRKRLIKPYKLSALTDYAHLMTLENFIDNVNAGGFIDYDGFGKYVKNNKESDITIIPSDVKHGSVRKDFTHVNWFNR